MAGLAAAGSARAMGAIVRGFDTRFVLDIIPSVQLYSKECRKKRRFLSSVGDIKFDSTAWLL